VGHLVQPSCRSRVTYSRLQRTLSRRVLNISRERELQRRRTSYSTLSLSNKHTTYLTQHFLQLKIVRNRLLQASLRYILNAISKNINTISRRMPTHGRRSQLESQLVHQEETSSSAKQVLSFTTCTAPMRQKDNQLYTMDFLSVQQPTLLCITRPEEPNPNSLCPTAPQTPMSCPVFPGY